MTGRKVIGEVKSTQQKTGVYWTIKDFFSYTMQGESYNSPSFNISDCNWYLNICPNGDSVEGSEWISLYLYKDTYSYSPWSGAGVKTGASYRFGLKNVDGTLEKVHGEIHWVFEEDNIGLGIGRFFKRSVLLRRKSELVPNNALTITCNVWVHEHLQSSKSDDTLSQNFADMLTTKRNCDVTLKVQQEALSAHKFVLEARSPVFRTMLDSDMAEKITGVVDIPDCDPQAFKVFLSYLYSGEVEDLSNNVFDVFYIAHKYDVKGLKAICLISIMGGLSLENVLDAAIFADRYDEDGVSMKAHKFFNKNFSSIVSTAKWESLLDTNYRLANKLLKNMTVETQLKK